MDGAELATTPTPALNHPSRPTLGFPLGTALLLIVIFCLSGIFSCCYHWEKLRSFRDRRRRRHGNQPSLDAVEDGQLPQFSQSSPASKVALQHEENKVERIPSFPVIMPGDRMPKFMAWPCPPGHQEAFTHNPSIS
ncbi:hypothetical protein C4D60_Mb04t19660 [Musa balbisiana]|uniref:Hydroxyproline-rich glycoprotein family protein n=1 Tax=Musa balbisiana TaxID=52838 RepID=A0A4S8KDB1_MUSBA|nr:hypothetical protein C4D60_Mb04t19660 [Musa balbisiana]